MSNPGRICQASITRRVNQLMDEFGDCGAVQHEFVWTTWGDLAQLRDQLVPLVQSLPPDAAVGVILRERPSAVGALLSLLALGRSVLQFTPIQPDGALVGDIHTLRPAMLLADAQDWRREGLVEAARSVGCVGVQVSASGVAPVDGTAAVAAGREGTYYRAHEGLAITLLTSGTTGPPKRVPLSYAIIDAWSDEVTQRDPSTAAGAVINSLPLVTVGGITGLIKAAWRGRPIALLDRFDPMKWARLVEEHKPRRTGAPPAAMRMILDAGVPKEMLASVETFVSGSAPLPPQLAEEFEDAYGIPVLHGYGATEFLGRLLNWTLEDWHQWRHEKRGSAGRPVPGAAVRIVDPATGTVLGPDKVGMLEASPAQRPSDAPEGWLRTNDVARIDGDGFVWIVGRADGVIIRGGFKVLCSEVEDAIRTHPDVVDVVVVGLPDDRLGEVPVAAVVPRSSAELSIAGLDRLVRSLIAPYKVPVRYVVVGDLPRNPMMKPLRAQVRDRFLTGEA